MSPWSPCEKNRKITIVSTYYPLHIHTGEKLWQTGLKTDTCVCEGRTQRSFVPEAAQDVDICCINHLTGHNWNHLTWRDGLGDFSTLWWGFGVHVLVTELLAWSHVGSWFSKPQHQPSFAIHAHQTDSCSDRDCLLWPRCSCGFVYLGNFCSSAKKKKKKKKGKHT